MGRSNALRLTAAGPVTGAIVSRVARGHLRDLAIASSSEPLGNPAVVPVVPGAGLTLAFASPLPGAYDVRLLGIGRDGAQVTQASVEFRGGETRTWTMPAGWAATYLRVEAPRRGRVQGVATYDGAAGTAQLPIRAGTWAVVHPAVVP